MKSTKFSSKNFLSHRISSHWYLGLLSAIVFLISMPFALNLQYGSVRNSHNISFTTSIEDRLIDTTISFFQERGMMATFILSYCIATVIGLFMYSFLNDKKQINFYHSQPISRKKIFLHNYVASLCLGLIPLLLSFIVGIILSTATVGWVLSPQIIFMQALGLIVFYNIALSLSILGCQFTGNKVFAIYSVGFVNFFVLIMASILINALNGFSSTLHISMRITEKLSPALYYISNIISNDVYVFKPIQLLAYLLFSIVFLGIAYGLYSIRPSEASEKTIVFPPIGWFIKFISAFVLAYGFGLFCTAIGGITFYNISFIIMFFVAVFFIEATYRRTFKNLKTFIIPSLVATITAFAIIWGISQYAQILDTHVPKAETVDTLKLDFVNDIHSYRNYRLYKDYSIEDPELIKEILSMIDLVVKSSNYISTDSFNRSYVYESDSEYSVSLNITYNNSKFISRNYTLLDVGLIMEELSHIYEAPKYKEYLLNNYIYALENESLKTLQFDIYDYIFYDVSYDQTENTNYNHPKDYVKPLIEASIKDFNNRKYKDTLNPNLGNLFLDFSTKEEPFSTNVSLSIFPTDTHMLKVMEDMEVDPQYEMIFLPYDYTNSRKG